MRFELFIALRYLFTRRRQSFISVISLVSVLSVALGVASLIVVLGVMNGFSRDLRDKILGVNAHVILMSLEGGMESYAEEMETVAALPGVIGVTPFIYSEVMLSTAHGVKGVILRGIDPVTADKALNIAKDLQKGSLADLAPGDGPPGLIIGQELARRLGLDLGSRVNLLSPAGQKSAAGFTPKVKIFQIVGIFRTGMFEYDTSLAFIGLEAARELLGFRQVLATGLEVKVDDVYAAGDVGRRIEQALGHPYYARSWMDMNANLFAALKLEKTAMFIILAMIVVVGSFSIITTLVMMVMEKTRDIAVLISMGACKVNIRRIFMLQGTIIGFFGTLTGFLLGIPTSLALRKYQFIKLPADVYSLDHLPVLLEPLDMVGIACAALVLCFVATIYPARKAASLNPAEALRFE